MQKNKFFIMVLLVMAINFSFAQVTLPHYEAFDYNDGDSLPMHGWIGLNGGDQILVTAGSLDYTGLDASVGNKVSFAGTGRDFQKTFTSQTSGTVYMSFIFQVTDLGNLDNLNGGYFTGVAADGTNFGSTVWLRKNGTSFNIGCNARSTPVANNQWDAALYEINTPIFVVVSYEMVTGATNDIVNIWINPDANSFGGTTPPTPNLTLTSAADLSQVSRIFLRQDSDTETPSTEVDEIRVGLSWAEVTPPAGVGIKEITSALDFQLAPNPSNGKFNILAAANYKSTYDVKIYDVMGKVVYTQNNITSDIAMNLSNLNRGIYFVQVKDSNSSIIASKKMIIQ